MRFLLALTLVLHLSGVPATWARPCAMATAPTAHACCVQHQPSSGQHVGGRCQCQVAPAPTAPNPSSPTTILPEGGAASALAAADEGSSFVVRPVEQAFGAASPPGLRSDDHPSLTGSGFRC